MDGDNFVRDMLEEELERNGRACAAYEAEIARLPRGSVEVRRRGSREYCYLKYRDGSRVVTEYAGPAEKVEGELRSAVERRRAAEATLRRLDAERRFTERALGLR